jgi:hypothetical protein
VSRQALADAFPAGHGLELMDMLHSLFPFSPVRAVAAPDYRKL